MVLVGDTACMEKFGASVNQSTGRNGFLRLLPRRRRTKPKRSWAMRERISRVWTILMRTFYDLRRFSSSVLLPELWMASCPNRWATLAAGIEQSALSKSVQDVGQMKALMNPSMECATHPISGVSWSDLNGYLAYATTSGGQSMVEMMFYPSWTSLLPIHRPRREEGLVVPGGRPEARMNRGIVWWRQPAPSLTTLPRAF